ncbi:MAG: hypothetical protein WCI30_09110 [Clostridia bacterium]
MKKLKFILGGLVAVCLALILLIFIFVNQQGLEKASFKPDFKLAVIETTEQANKSTLSFYNQTMEKIATQEIKLGAMGSSFDLPRIYNGSMYIIPQGLGNKKDLTVILEYNLETGTYKTYDMQQPAMNSFAVNEQALYSANTINNQSIISWYDKGSGVVKTIVEPEIYISRIDLYDDTLYAFVMTKDNSGTKAYLYLIDTKSFEITDKIDISASGPGQNYSMRIGENIYFTNQYEISENSNIGSYDLSKFNINTKKITNIKLAEQYPFQIQVYQDKLLISHYNLVQNQGNKITIYDPKTNMQELVTLKNNLNQILIEKDQLYTRDGKYLNIYNINNGEFTLTKQIAIYTKSKSRTFYYVAGFFTK